MLAVPLTPVSTAAPCSLAFAPLAAEGESAAADGGGGGGRVQLPGSEGDELRGCCLAGDLLVLCGIALERIYTVRRTELAGGKAGAGVGVLGPTELGPLGVPLSAAALPGGGALVACAGGIAELDAHGSLLRRWLRPEGDRCGAGEIAVPQRAGAAVAVCAEWAPSNVWRQGRDPSNAAEYSNSLVVWSLESRSVAARLSLGSAGEGRGALSVALFGPGALGRPAGQPACAGYCGCALDGSVHYFAQAGGGWTRQKALQVRPAESGDGRAVPAICCSVRLSADGMWLYTAQWLQGDVRQYSVADRASPVLVGRVRCGGTLAAPSAGPAGCCGGPGALAVAPDGARLWVALSLFRAWDLQHFPSTQRSGAGVIALRADTATGGLEFCGPVKLPPMNGSAGAAPAELAAGPLPLP
eukprot:TRINITY_DN43223_c0_g1_i1.p1 TRINITY_DN43223_c0_g1~~TRINITY_DN43223_c0_g1_i1.p1  ORF type:complete len:435 (+),score=95.34 TRINITY_DN43223_c0_g1_i1:69-1307(+)